MLGFRRFGKSEDGAVAPVYVLSLTALIILAGVGYDYAQLATLDTELQGAADQAALAGATQLDGKVGAMAAAEAAAQNLVRNNTVFANDAATNSGIVIDDTKFEFYATKAAAEAGTPTVNTDAAAKFIKVQVVSRRAHYTLTPILGIVQGLSPSVTAMATAGMGSSLCRVPPVFTCNPNPDPAVFNIDSLIGKGLLLKTGSGYAPGNFGFLVSNAGNGANALSQVMGYDVPPGDCVSLESPETEPGNKVSIVNEFNTRFDIYDQGDSIGCLKDGLCPPSDNTRKDLVQSGTLTTASNLNKKACGIGKNSWEETPGAYRPTSDAPCSTQACAANGNQYPDAMGYPRDRNHAWPNPNIENERFGSGIWDKDAFCRVNYPSDLTARATCMGFTTRYEVYKWERSTPNYRNFNSSGAYTDFKSPMCLPGRAPSPTNPDRRVLPVAIVNCSLLGGGRQTIHPIGWMDVFLVEPSVDRKKGGTSYTGKDDIYVEVIGKTTQGAADSGSQVVRRDKPYLVK